ncbi:conserved hypothetical protein [Arthrobacter sp. 9V]|uniref:hypothetical protein n=1 Tax=Arthrobacter sp. 9V TaxID=2653132 RepID=UPI0012F2A191|nr:hypothetical protein [Arthrobacter sp. 9V]VXB51665.1 conserved hypothetical protein [Arthrobacter sp. 9V]
MADFTELQLQMAALDELTRDAYVEEVLVIPMDGAAAMDWKRMASRGGEDWVYAVRGSKTLAVDRPSHLAHRNPVEGVVFSPLHSQLVGWWLFHAWRSVDLLKTGIESSSSGTTSVAAVTSRALLEELGCLVTELGLIRKAWETAKLPDVDTVRRAELLGGDLVPLMTRLLFASRMSSKPANAPSATNVLTYISKLDKLSKSSKFSDWYDWLSDASHPAFGARLVYVTNPLRHASGSTALRLHSRSPLRLVDPTGDQVNFTYDIEDRAGAALETCGLLLVEHLYAALRLVDDFGLTTSASAMTQRTYWRNLLPVQPTEACPCKCGPWAQSLHAWRTEVPSSPLITT